MIKRTLISLAALTALAAAATPASADVVVDPLADAQAMTALRGTVVWIDGDRLNHHAADGAHIPVPGAPAGNYRSVDLGLTASGRVVLTYRRCQFATSDVCQVVSDDLNGHRVSFKRLAPKRCEVTSAPARWRDRVAYGLSCAKPHGPPNVFDAQRSGLFVRTGNHAPKRLRLPDNVGGNESYFISSVDLRGERVAAVVHADGVGKAIAQGIDRSQPRSVFVSGGGEEARDFEGGTAIGTNGAMWSLSFGFESSSVFATIRRVGRDGCIAADHLPAPPPSIGADYPASAMAVDGDRLYLFVRGTGIVTHPFNPGTACA